MNSTVDLSASIVPGRSAGGIPIGTYLKAIYAKLKYDVYSNSAHSVLGDPFYVSYNLRGAFCITVHVLNGKIIKLGCLPGYLGEMKNGIRPGMRIDQAMKIEPRIYLDEDDGQYYIKDVPGVTMECEEKPNETNIISAITVYLPALKSGWTSKMEGGEWPAG